MKLLESGRSIQSIVLEFQVGKSTTRDWKKIKNELYELEKRNNLALVSENILRNSNYPDSNSELKDLCRILDLTEVKMDMVNS